MTEVDPLRVRAEQTHCQINSEACEGLPACESCRAILAAFEDVTRELKEDRDCFMRLHALEQQKLEKLDQARAAERRAREATEQALREMIVRRETQRD